MGIGMRIKEALRDRNMTIKQLAEESGISINTLYSITKRDSERVDSLLLQKIASVLQVDANWLRYGRTQTERNQTIEALMNFVLRKRCENTQQREEQSCSSNEITLDDALRIAEVDGIPFEFFQDEKNLRLASDIVSMFSRLSTEDLESLRKYVLFLSSNNNSNAKTEEESE